MSHKHWISARNEQLLAFPSVVAIEGGASGAFVPIGGSQFPAPAEPDPSGGTVIDSQTVAVNGGSFTGLLTSRVISGDTSNTLGGYTFTYQFTNTDSDSSATSVHRITVSEYDTFATDTSYQIPLSGVAPTAIDRAGSGDVIGFSFLGFGPGPINPGQSSALLVVQTNALQYANSLASVIDGTSDNVAAFAPTAVPEPSALCVLALGAGAALVRRRIR